MSHTYNGIYSDRNLERVAFPLGGIGAGMICLEGAGGFSNVSLRHGPEMFNDPLLFSTVSFPGSRYPARVLAGPVPEWKILFPWGNSAGNGAPGKDFGLPRFESADFLGRFPFGRVRLNDGKLPVSVEALGWSPFTPPEADDSSLPVAAIEYSFTNTTDSPLELVYSFHAANFLRSGKSGSRVRRGSNGFILEQDATSEDPSIAGAFAAAIADRVVAINPAWFRGGWFDSLTMLWNDIDSGALVDRVEHPDDMPSPGGSVSTRLLLPPFGRETVVQRFSWYVPHSKVRHQWDEPDASKSECCGDGSCCSSKRYFEPWYASKFEGLEAVTGYWNREYARLRTESQRFSSCLYDTTLPAEVVEAVATNLGILKSPTVLRQADGRMWNYEGCCDTHGCCFGSCTHVWNYAQAVPHLFPGLERTLRESELLVSQDERGHQAFRTALPIGPAAHTKHAAADGQLGGIVKLYREWRISADTSWLESLWPAAKRSLEYCIETWDPDHTGTLVEPHHNTYDIEFWGPDGMCTTIYLAALEAAARMAEALGEAGSAEGYRGLAARGRKALESDLYDGEYFVQRVTWKGMRAGDPTKVDTIVGNIYASEEARALLETEGPKYQYGTGCLSDGVLGVWLALVSGIDGLVDEEKVTSHLEAIHRYNFRRDLSSHANPQRPTYALGNEAGLLLCSWPKGGARSLPFVYSNEVWTGIEYQVAAHLAHCGKVTEGLEIVRACRDRYDGTVRNPFDEIECGHFYARALASYSLLQTMSGVRYDALTKTLFVAPPLPGDLQVLLSTATGYGTVSVESGEVRLEVRHGAIEVKRVEYTPARTTGSRFPRESPKRSSR